VPRLWSPTEVVAATTFADDSRIARALQHTKTFGVAEILAAMQHR
jgi:hypothetical protein